MSVGPQRFVKSKTGLNTTFTIDLRSFTHHPERLTTSLCRKYGITLRIKKGQWRAIKMYPFFVEAYGDTRYLAIDQVIKQYNKEILLQKLLSHRS
jgi:hypothetical protein